MSAFHDNALMGASGQQGYQISRSVRLRSSASAYFSRTPASAGNRRTWTWSGWVKLGSIGQWEGIFNAGSSGNQFAMYLYTDNTLYIQDYTGSNNIYLQTTQVFRDPSSWYHIVLSVDTTQATSTNRVKLYINGVQVTAFASTTYPSQNYDTQVNSTSYQHNIGLNYQFGTSNAKYYDGYLTEINFIDGQALTPSSFGQTNSVTGVWQPIKYTGTYGTNGFYLNFSDNSNNTAATIGKDYSGNGNNWTPNNISVTSGVTYDSMIDVPTLTSNTAANYPVINPLTSGASSYVSNGNLQLNPSGGNGYATIMLPSSGKFYFEAVPTNYWYTGSYYVWGGVGVITNGQSLTTNFTGAFMTSNVANGQICQNGTNVQTYTSWATNDVIGIAVDMGAGTMSVYRNNTLLQSGLTLPPGDICFYVYTYGGSNTIVANFGQRPFAYTPPTGFNALNTFNLPTPTIANGATVMAATTYTGTGSSQTIANTVNSVNFKPDLVWIKSRSGATNNELTDSVRGTTKALVSNSTAAETTDTNGLTAFGSTGFTVGSDTNYNNNTATYVAWQWQAGQGTTSSNTSGSITSTVSVNATAGFSVLTATTPASYTNYTAGHGLGVTPAMIIYKERSGTANWWVWHKSFATPSNALQLNTTVAIQAGTYFGTQTSTVASFASGIQTGLSVGFVAYCFAEVAGYSAFGSVSANGASDNAFVYTGFLPRYVLLKRTDSTSNWIVWDTARNTYNVLGAELYPNLSNAESTVTDLDILSNGFKLRNSSFTGTWIYAAFASAPFKYSLGF